MRRFRIALMGLTLVMSTAAPSRADVTAFLGATTTPTNRATTGVAAGTGLLLVGLEFEYSSAKEDLTTGAPSLRMGHVNGLLQSPIPIHGIQPYVTAGAGIYRERVGALATTGLAPNIGGGLKIELAGPLRLRVDYRVFRLGDKAAYTPSHRLYAGLNVKF